MKLTDKYHWTREIRWEGAGSPAQARYFCSPIVNKYREGKVKRTPGRGVKQNLKRCAYKESEPFDSTLRVSLRVNLYFIQGLPRAKVRSTESRGDGVPIEE